MKKLILALTLTIAVLYTSRAGDYTPYDLVGGIGIPEALHLGASYQFAPKNQLAFTLGNNLRFSENNSYFTFILEHRFYFGAYPEIGNRQLWFFRQSLNYGVDNSSYSSVRYLLFNLSVGREYHFNERWGVSADAGLFRALLENEKVKDPSQSPWLRYNLQDFLVVPCFRIQVFYSIISETN